MLLAPWSRHATETAPSDVSLTQVAWPHKRSVVRREIPAYAICRCDILRDLLDLLYHGGIRMQQLVFCSVGTLGIGTTYQPLKIVFRCQILSSPQGLILYLKYLLPYQNSNLRDMACCSHQSSAVSVACLNGQTSPRRLYVVGDKCN